MPPFYQGDVIQFREIHLQMVEGCKYECLKEVEFLGWSGLVGEVQLVKHLIQAAGSLETMTIHPVDHLSLEDVLWKHMRTLPPNAIAATKDARNRALDLEPKLTPTIKLVVL
ncbi:hypothetical protein ACH5RR_030662 [Cinchona calisaya]|uniref:FBD domain-containing protein n=1 Tax=Cinchona calisaya TaxID=153742 RepID=A0ABD2YWH6_9GENT